MSQKKKYSRYFIILQEDEKGYGLASDKAPTGYAKLEVKNSKCKVSFYVQNLKKEMKPYYILLICDKKDNKKLVKLGELNIDNTGRAEISKEFTPENIASSGISVDKVSGAAVVRSVDTNIVSVLNGFAVTDIPKDWKKYTLIDNVEKRDNEEKQKSEENNTISKENKTFDEYEEKIEKIKASDLKENSSKVQVKEVEKKENDLSRNDNKEYEEDNIEGNKDEEKRLSEEDIEDENVEEDLEDISEEEIEDSRNLKNKLLKHKSNKENKFNKHKKDNKAENKDKVKEKPVVNKENKDKAKESNVINKENKDKAKESNIINKENKDKAKESNVINKENKDKAKGSNIINKEDITDIKDNKKVEDKKYNVKEITSELKSGSNEIKDVKYNYKGSLEENIKSYDKKAEVNGLKDNISKGRDILDNKYVGSPYSSIISKDNNLNNNLNLKDNIDTDNNIKSYNDNFINDDNKGIQYNNEDNLKKEKKQVEPKTKSSKFFHGLTKNLQKWNDDFEDLSRCEWYKIPIRSIEDMYKASSYNRYTILYYPMISYFPYIIRHGHYLFGYKYDNEGRVKYIVYGIPGTKAHYDQPFGGKFGFVSWVQGENNKGKYGNMGYWLLFYDFRKSVIVIPVNK
ncbi:hypothetical protein CPAST_c01740 [Clostridium pasteurianum DSM 525 = ATCC 6013]|uniref:Transmembrane protein n=1 Tax=Clostridium pasteurianum DSM 525 = ATCC 6013 TaxID=1262449 RepID=A0A0H3IZ19_CLOPA|nr:hypothetical protein [Clostridium pasteurianum]AJA46274.1 hypothetical protein CPAST_c01740 [Clostridium pasteurianum DSM 525 = ATCC 6013]AJA50262.1 hypothetical protein CLPA_c01740 [Clostridium pasteurianum DSM 525 = ATCC 6013]AOZ73726.1 hypothetical protein AQ983_00855 [Clostridium pasteurianum DSM 525 = ATCC 6013]AOZ77523.1 hypothetical protein AQ984_00855 [Clostridium pasteurianum]ELP60858.1 hypothetical protein F502_00315 [Clostridium pasteurianum DSM 525 = ATCC 6013]